MLLAGLFATALTAGAQAPSQPAPSAAAEKKEVAKEAKAKPKRIWTDEDLTSLRKPADEYVAQKLAALQAAESADQKPAEAGAAETKAGESQPSGAPKDSKTARLYEDPNSPQFLERELRKWQDELQHNEQLLEDARREMSQTTDKDRWEIAKQKVEIFEENRAQLQKLLEETRTRLAEARKQSSGGARSSSGEIQPGSGNPPPSPQPPL